MCNLFGSPDEVKQKLDVLRGHCERVGRNFDEIERSLLTGLLLARDEAALQAKLERLGTPEPGRTTALTVSRAIGLVGRYEDVGVQLLITRIWKNDPETMELLASNIMPHFR